MKTIKVLGPVFPKCQKLLKNTEQAVAELGLDCQIEMITDIMRITSYGVMMTPALVIDGEVKMVGKVPSLTELKELLS